jgi:serine phosphatase RsbU (regulator of sigma subunit)
MYLENNLSAGAFTAQRVEMMKMLSAQIAVSIENARLYSDMERMVAERTAQLSMSLEEIQALKSQQDGDYFLTSLLLEPLGKNLLTNSRVKIDYIVKAKKEFKFKKWERELGGDICAAYDIKLKDKQYALFMNADAMGKSIQGAGGAIVLGAIFKAMVERTSVSDFLQNQSPRDWLVSALRELQSVFESFDCSMLMSLVLGLVDPEEAMVYFVNSEHPFMALYRGGRATFLEKESSTRKLGIPGLVIPDRVFAMRLKPGDVIIAGSDGRDDILIGGTADARIINEDETLFLRAVENAGGGLKEIYDGILSTGELTDDISLVRIEYNP